MNIEETLINEHSRASADHIVSLIGDDPAKFKILMNLFFNGGYRINQRAAMPVGICARKKPELIKPYLEKMIRNLDQPIHDAVKRNTLRIFQDIEIPENLHGNILEKCFEYLNSNKEPVAIKVFAMTVIFNLTKCYPELANELKIIIEDQMPYGTAGFKSRGSKILKKLQDITP